MVKEMKKGEMIRVEWREQYGNEREVVTVKHPYIKDAYLSYVIKENILFSTHVVRVRRNQDGTYTLWVGDSCPVKRKERYHVLSVLDDMENIPQEVIEKVEQELYREWYAL